MRKVPFPCWIALTVAVLAWPRAAAAEGLCGTASKAPLLDGTYFLSVGVPRPVPQYQEMRTTFFIFKDGTGVVSRSREDVDGTTGVRTARGAVIACGKASAATFERFNLALGQLRPGARQSCFDTASSFAARLLSSTWHGKNGRTNRFTVTGLDESLPACGPEADAFLQTLEAFMSDVLAAPGTQKLSTGAP
jgi:hypothetical protein